MIFVRRAALVLVFSAVLASFLNPPAYADSDNASETERSIVIADTRASESNQKVLERVAQVPTSISGRVAIRSRVGGVDVEIPTDPKNTFKVTNNGQAIGLHIPFAARASNASKLRDGVLSYNNRNGSSTTTVVKEDGSIQFATVIQSEDAPQRFEYPLEMPAGVEAQSYDSGLILFRKPGGGLLAFVSPPWARDAKGAPVPTHYEISDRALVQVVDHREQAVQYPIVADPFLGVQLFTNMYTGNWHGDITYNGTVSAGGVLLLATSGPAGPGVFRTYGWGEWTAKWPAITNKPTLQQQYECHVLGGLLTLPFTGPYNLERAQANNPNWIFNVAIHHCNWTP